MLQAHRRRGLNAVPVGMVPDAVLAQGLNNVGPAAPLQYPRLFTDYLEGSLNAERGQIVCNAESGIVSDGIDVVLSVEPKNNIGHALSHSESRKQEEQHRATKNKSVSHVDDLSYR